MKTVSQLSFVAKQASLNVIEQSVLKNTKAFTQTILLNADLLNGVNRKTVDFILDTIFTSGLTDELEAIRTSRKSGKYVKNAITTMFLTR